MNLRSSVCVLCAALSVGCVSNARNDRLLSPPAGAPIPGLPSSAPLPDLPATEKAFENELNQLRNSAWMVGYQIFAVDEANWTIFIYSSPWTACNPGTDPNLAPSPEQPVSLEELSKAAAAVRLLNMAALQGRKLTIVKRIGTDEDCKRRGR